MSPRGARGLLASPARSQNTPFSFLVLTAVQEHRLSISIFSRSLCLSLPLVRARGGAF